MAATDALLHRPVDDPNIPAVAAKAEIGAVECTTDSWADGLLKSLLGLTSITRIEYCADLEKLELELEPKPELTPPVVPRGCRAVRSSTRG